MTSEEKRDKREARRQVEASLRRIVRRSTGLYSTPAQERQHLRTMVDRFYREQVTPAAKRIESRVFADAVKRMEAATE